MEKKAVKNRICGVTVTSPSKHSMKILEYFVVLGFLFLCLGFWFLGEFFVWFLFLGFFFRSFFPGRFILLVLQQTFASSHETRQPEFHISEEELEVVVRNIFHLFLLKLFYASKTAEIIMKNLWCF